MNSRILRFAWLLQIWNFSGHYASTENFHPSGGGGGGGGGGGSTGGSGGEDWPADEDPF